MPDKVASLFGINYKGTPCELRGCINDVNAMADVLRKRNFGDVRVLTESTRADIERELTRLRLLSWSGVTDMYVHFSGHGCQVLDRNGDELDGLDECVVPFDFATAGIIADDYLAGWVRGVNPATRLTMVFDCCHSGTIVDLPFVLVADNAPVVNKVARVTRKQPVLVMSGCRDNQTSADAFNVGGSGIWAGALTACLIDSIADVDDARKLTLTVTRLLRERGFGQLPQLTSTHPLEGVQPFLKLGK